MRQVEKENVCYSRLNGCYEEMVVKNDGNLIYLMVVERTNDYEKPFGDIGGRVLGLCLLKADKLLYMDFSIFLKQC